jgi:hypothetical protein
MEKLDILLFSELINFEIKIILEKPKIVFYVAKKYSEGSKNLEKILRDILEHGEPK